MRTAATLTGGRFPACLAVAALAILIAITARDTGGARAAPVDGDRLPVDLVLAPDGRHLLTANRGAGTVSLVDPESGHVLAELPSGEMPAAVVVASDGRRVLVSGSFGGDLTVFDRVDKRLTLAGAVKLGFEPHGIAVSPDGQRAYVALSAAGAVAVVDLIALREIARIDVGRWPRSLALSPDGTRLAVGVNGDGGIAVVDTAAGRRLYLEDFAGLNVGQMHVTPDGRHVYFPFMVYRQRPITPANVQQGWVMASRIARVRLDGPARREAIALDARGAAVSDPHGLALSPDGQWLYCAAAGTHELLVYRLAGLPFQDYGGPGDHIDPELLGDQARFYRIPLGGRPMAVRVSSDGKLVYVANYLLNAVQVVDPKARSVKRTISLGGPPEPSAARRGEAIFYDGRRSLDQWYSCHSCHYDGHTNAVTMDTRNDGRFGNYKAILSLRNVIHTGPWMWHGSQTDLAESVRKSLTDSMLGPPPSAQDVRDVTAFLGTLKQPPNPYHAPDGGLTDAAQRGAVVFQSDKGGCARCHSGAYRTDGKVHQVGTGEAGDVYKGYNPPSLIGTFDRPFYLHDGRSKSLEDLLTGPHSPDELNGKGELTKSELSDLISYLKSL